MVFNANEMFARMRLSTTTVKIKNIYMHANII